MLKEQIVPTGVPHTTALEKIIRMFNRKTRIARIYMDILSERGKADARVRGRVSLFKDVFRSLVGESVFKDWFVYQFLDM